MTGAFAQAMGACFENLPPEVRQLHGAAVPTWQGRVTVTGATGLAGRLVVRIAGFPGPMRDAPLALRITGNGRGHEIWTRDFDGHVTRSELYCDGRGRLMERFGPVTLALLPALDQGALTVKVAACWLFGWLPMPQLLCPGSDSRVWQDDGGSYRFDIGARLPGFGEVIRYRGWLAAG